MVLPKDRQALGDALRDFVLEAQRRRDLRQSTWAQGSAVTTKASGAANTEKLDEWMQQHTEKHAPEEVKKTIAEEGTMYEVKATKRKTPEVCDYC